jgi:hypothetical protein
MIYLTGDPHGSHTINKLASSRFPEGKTLTKSDYVVILGDFGLLWKDEPDNNERYWMEWLTEKPWTTIVVPGNHENWKRIYDLKCVNKFGAPIRKYNESIYIMKRGEIYNLDNKTIFNMGGAMSIDRNVRILDKSWWEEEIPTLEEFEHGLENLDRYNWKVDYIFGHTTSNAAIDHMFKPRWKINDAVSTYWDEIVKNATFRMFYFGHWHKDQEWKKYRALYHEVVLLGE